MKTKNKDLLYFLILVLFAGVLFIRYFEHRIIKINSTELAFSYKYGFISRGLVGTVYRGLDKILPFDIMTYDGLYYFFLLSTFCLYALIFLFAFLCLKRSGNESKKGIIIISLVYIIYAIPMFAANYNFGRLDLYCLMVTIIAVISIITGRLEWIAIIMSALGVMIHQGYVFMYFSIVLVLLLYKAMSDDNRDRKKSLIILIISFTIGSALFLYFELFSHVNGEGIYEEIVGIASKICANGDYHADVIDHEVLGIDLSDREIVWRWHNGLQLPFYILFMLPYIVIGVRFFKGLITKSVNKVEKYKYIFVAIGSLTILPDMIFKCDYGRWMFCITSYYCIVIMALVAMGDKLVIEEMNIIIEELWGNKIILFLILYLLLFQPLADVNICPITTKIGDTINGVFHFYVDP